MNEALKNGVFQSIPNVPDPEKGARSFTLHLAAPRRVEPWAHRLP
jgi:hypothetical protein